MFVNKFDRDIRDVAYWNYALSSSQVQNLFLSGIGFVEADAKEDAIAAASTSVYVVSEGILRNVQFLGDPAAPLYSCFQVNRLACLAYFLYFLSPFAMNSFRRFSDN